MGGVIGYACVAVYSAMVWLARAGYVKPRIRSDGPDIRVRRVATKEEFAALKDTWNGILEKCVPRGVFLAWEWLYFWWLNFGGGKTLFILIMERCDTGETVGIVPLCMEKVRLAGSLPVRRLKFLGTEQVGSDFLDFIMLPGNEQAVVRAFYRYLARHCREWDVVEISDIDRDSSSVTLLQSFNGRYRVRPIPQGSCPYIELPGSFPEYIATLTVKARRELRKKTKDFEGTPSDFVLMEGVDACRKFDDVFRLHEDGFSQKKYGKGVASSFSSEKVRKFHYDVIPALMKRQWLKLYFLRHKGQAIACSYALKYRNSLFVYQTGFNSDWKKWSLGTVLTGYCIRKSIEEGLHEFHYLRGAEAYKSRWAKRTVTVMRLVIANRNVRGQLYGCCAGAKNRLKKLLIHSPVPAALNARESCES